MTQLRVGRLAMVIAAAITIASAKCLAQSSSLVENPLALAARERIERALDEPASIDVVEQPLKDVAASLQKRHDVLIQLDEKAIIDAGESADLPLTANLSNIRLRSALDLLLRPHELNWIIEHDVLVITSDTKARERIETRVYPVRDLVEVHDEHGISDDYDSLLDVITSTISPTAWSDSGGTGSISPFPNSKALVISQTREIHEEIGNLLTVFRSVRAQQGLDSGRSVADQSGDDDFDHSSDKPDEAERDPPHRKRAAPVLQPTWRLPQVYK